MALHVAWLAGVSRAHDLSFDTAAAEALATCCCWVLNHVGVIDVGTPFPVPLWLLDGWCSPRWPAGSDDVRLGEISGSKARGAEGNRVTKRKKIFGGAKLILCTTKPEAENPVRTNESQTSNNFLSN